MAFPSLFATSAILLIGSLLVVDPAWGKPNGAPPEACEDMRPQHGVDAQDGPCPFQVVALKVR